VQEALEEALFKLTGEVETSVAGRTDAGVHARAQVMGFELDSPIDCDAVTRSLNSQLVPHIAVSRLLGLTGHFSARFDATWRAYDYLVVDGGPPDPFTAGHSWQLGESLDSDAMNAAAAAFIGERDFASLCRKAGDRSTVRSVHAADWLRPAAHRIRYRVEASSFCHQMVRSMVAVCVDAGRGKLDPDDVPGILAARDRQAARGVAPPHGLALIGVGYADEHGGPLMADPLW
jgi:tRNA pseudouridine38-40 synthase